MAQQTPTPEKKWHEILLPQVGGLVTALSVALVGSLGAYVLHQKQDAENRAKVYAELTSQREQADSLMRKDMFAKIIELVLKEKDETPDRMVLNMELLAYNFHESLNLKPLFAYVLRRLGGPPSPQQYIDRLEKVARDVNQKQLLILEEAGTKFDRTIELKNFPIVVEPESKTLAGIERVFRIVVRSADFDRHEIEVELEIRSGEELKSVAFTVGPYDFPMIDNTRLSADQRCAVVLQKFEKEAKLAEIRLVYFPGSRASLREKTFSDDIIRNLENPRRD